MSQKKILVLLCITDIQKIVYLYLIAMLTVLIINA